MLCWGLLVCAVLAGCNQPKQTDDGGQPQAKPIVKTADRGPIKLTVTAGKDEISIAERLDLGIEVTAEPGIEVKMPEFGAEMTDFQIRDFRDRPVEELKDRQRRYRQEYDLDIFLSGEYTIPAITVRYRDRRGHGLPEVSGPEEVAAINGAATSEEVAATPTDGDQPDIEADAGGMPWAELSTEPFTIKVRSLLEGEFDPKDFRDVKGVVEVPVERSWRWVAWTAAAVAGGGLVLVSLVVLLVRYLRRPAPMNVVPPHEWAWQQLRNLAQGGLIEEGRIREFHYQLSEIARTYIELRFGLMAPERTTEEFLEELRGQKALPAEHQPHLIGFLEACDMVKYALYEPATTEIEEVFNAARDFIERTSRVPPPVKEMEEVAA